MALQESGEMYLETIYVLTKSSSFVRAVDISEHMGFSKPSVSRAMGLLKADGYITVDPQAGIRLTPRGLEVAQKIFERHTVIAQMLIRLGVEPAVAAADACRMEHAISDESFHALKTYLSSQI
jgi:Mn-dependent DtxR family transcriptional regulator